MKRHLLEFLGNFWDIHKQTPYGHNPLSDKGLQEGSPTLSSPSRTRCWCKEGERGRVEKNPVSIAVRHSQLFGLHLSIIVNQLVFVGAFKGLNCTTCECLTPSLSPSPFTLPWLCFFLLTLNQQHSVNTY